MMDGTGSVDDDLRQALDNHNIHEFEVVENADLYCDPYLVHKVPTCGMVVCDVEPGDNLASLVLTAAAHTCP